MSEEHGPWGWMMTGAWWLPLLDVEASCGASVFLTYKAQIILVLSFVLLRRLNR